MALVTVVKNDDGIGDGSEMVDGIAQRRW